MEVTGVCSVWMISKTKTGFRIMDGWLPQQFVDISFHDRSLLGKTFQLITEDGKVGYEEGAELVDILVKQA